MDFRVEVDTGEAPLFVYTIYGAAASPGQLQSRLLDVLERQIERRVPYVEVFDLRQAAPPPREVRQYLTAWMAVHWEQIHAVTLASGVVLSSRAMRMMMRAQWLIQPPPAQRYRTFSSRVAALTWAREHCIYSASKSA